MSIAEAHHWLFKLHLFLSLHKHHTHLVRGPSWAAGWRRGHSILSVGCERGETGSCSTPPLPWRDSPPTRSLCPRLTNPGDRQPQSPGPKTKTDIKTGSSGVKKKHNLMVLCLAIARQIWVEMRLTNSLSLTTANESLSNQHQTPSAANCGCVNDWLYECAEGDDVKIIHAPPTSPTQIKVINYSDIGKHAIVKQWL